jgi:O-antigen/teichoic acid export membrane protein
VSLFLSTVAVNSYTISIVFIVSFVLGPTAAGIYSIADRIRQYALGVFGPLSQALYPAICRTVLVGRSPDEAVAHRLVFWLMLASAAAISAGLFLFAEPICRLVGGPAFAPAVAVVKVIAFLPLVVTSTNILSTQTLLPNGMTRQFLSVTLVGAAVGITTVALASRTAGVEGAAWAVLATECVVLGFSAYLVKRHGLFKGLLFGHS